MTKIAFITDTHFGYKKGDERVAGYMSRFFNEVFFPELDKRGIDRIFHLGDLFDNRMEISTNVFDIVLDSFINPCVERNIMVDEILGNHDTRYKNTNKINTPSIILGKRHRGTYSENNEYFNLVENQVQEITIGSTTFALVPWINPENEETILEALSKSTASVVVGHFEIAGAKMDRVQVAQHGLSARVFERFDRVFSGHFHHKSQYGNIEYLGSPYEFTWIDCEDPKGFHIFDTETHELEFVRNPFTMFNKVVFDGTAKDIDPDMLRNTHVRIIVEKTDDPAALNNFINKVSGHAHDVKTIENPTVLTNIETAPEEIDVEVEDTLEIINRYIDNMSSGLVADRAKAHVQELYRKVIL